MKPSLPLYPLLAAFLLFLTACESTLDYGYYVDTFDDESIIQLFELENQAIAERDFEEYASFYAPNFTSTDRTSGSYLATNRSDYLELVKNLFESAKLLEVTTSVMDIDYVEPGKRAVVKVQEEERRIHFGNTQHYTSLIDVTVGFEDGWIYILKTERTDIQVIDE